MNRFFSPSFLSRWFARSKPSTSVARPACRRVRLILEALEDRSLPSMVTVTSASDDPSETGSLRYALDNATPGEVIDFAPDVRTIDLSNTLNISVNLSIVNDQGVGPVTIDGGGEYTVFGVPGSVTASLSGLTITDGNTTAPIYGGGILNQGTLTVSNSTFSDNSAGYGGGGIRNQGTLTVTDSTFSENSGSQGSGIENGGTTYVSACTFSGNSASGGDGGAAIDNSGQMAISDSIFSGNSVDRGYGGGGVVNEGGGTLTVSNSTFSNNSAVEVNYGGGGIFNNGGTLTVSNSTFSNNSTNSAGGGGIFNQGTLMVNDDTFSGNSAPSGGGIYDTGGTVTISNSTFSANSVPAGQSVSGGGICCAGIVPPPVLNSDIVVGNVPDDVDGFLAISSADNLIGTGGGLVNGNNGNQISATVAEVGLGPLANNGGPTRTFAIGPGSLAIGTGAIETTATTDQRGMARPIGQPSDVGAFQYSASPTVTVNPASQLIGAGQSTSFSAAASDGNPTPTVVQWQVSTDHGITFTDLGGVSSTTLTISDAPSTLSGDEYRAVFSNAAGLSATTSAATLTVATIAVAGGSPQDTVIGTAFSTALQARIVDGLGNPIANVPVTFTAPASGPTGTFSALTTVLSDGQGIATAPALTANHILGQFTVNATAVGIVSAAEFTLTNTAVPARIEVYSGSGQHAAVNSAYGTNLKALVTDSYDRPVVGITVVFELPGGASGTFATSAAAVTDANGIATASVLTANTKAGSFAVSAWVAGVDAPATFRLTNTPVAPFAVNVFAGTETALIGIASADKLQAQVVDQYGNPINGVKVTFTAPESGPSGTFKGKKSITVMSGANGLAGVRLTANRMAGIFQVIASALHVNTSAVFDLQNEPHEHHD